MKLLIGYAITLLLFSSCDFTTVGEIHNRSGEDIEIVIFPFSNSDYSILKSDKLNLTKWDTVNLKGYFLLLNNTHVPVASGINSFAPEELVFNYIEIRKSADTSIFETQQAIHNQFKETKNHTYQWIIE